MSNNPSIRSTPSLNLKTCRSASVSSATSSQTPDDIKSLCDELSQVMRDGLTTSSCSASSLPHHSAPRGPGQEEDSDSIDEGPFGSRYAFIRSTDEPSHIPPSLHGPGQNIRRAVGHVTFDNKQDVQEFEVHGLNRAHEKRGERGTTNLWRKYGALKKLQQVGGWAPRDYRDSKAKNFEFVSQDNSKMPQPPGQIEVTLNRDKRKPSIIGSIRIQKGSAHDEAQRIAREVQTMVEHCKPSSIQLPVDPAAKDRKKDNRTIRSGVGSLFRRLSGGSSAS